MSQAERTKARRSRRKKRKVTPVFGLWLLLIFCSLLSTYFFINSAFFALQNIKIEGNTILTDEDIVEHSGLAFGANLFQVDTLAAAAKIEMYPFIKTISIKRIPPNTINIIITERIATARILVPDGFVEVDDEGVYLNKTTGSALEQLPLISGVTMPQQNRPGLKLDSDGLTAALTLIEIMDSAILNNVAEISAASPEALTLKTVQGVEVRFGKPEELERKIQMMQNLLIKNETVINGQTVEYIDLRYDTSPVIKRKG